MSWGAKAAIAICIAFGLLGIAFPEPIAALSHKVTTTARHSLGWLLFGMTVGFLCLAIALAVGPWGRIRLGAPEDRPEFSTRSWLAMMFAAGMGQGLLFFGVAEPLQHFASPLADPHQAAAARQALVVTMFHWGVHAWGIYCIAGLVVAYFTFRRGTAYLPGAPLRSAFRGRWVSPVAWLSDLLALLAVVFGLGATLALGSKQLATGLEATTEVAFGGPGATVVLMWIVISAAIVSASSSLQHGIRWLSNANMGLMLIIMATVFAVGPTSYIAESGMRALVDYVGQLPALSFRSHPFTANDRWFESQSLTYFMWWISWSPFVGVFLARISRGRTVREVVAGVLLAPSLFSLCSFAIFGSAGFHEVLVEAHASIATAKPSLAIFELFDQLPLGTALNVAAIVTVFVFIVTSADSGTFVLGMLSSGGSLEPPTRRKIIWGIGLGLLSTVFVLANDVQVVLGMAMNGAVPFALVMLLQAVALIRALSTDARRKPTDDTSTPHRNLVPTGRTETK